MTKVEYAKCEKLMEEAIRNGKEAKEKFEIAWNYKDETQKRILINRAHNYQGYAEGINQALVCIGFKHERMKELGNLL